MSGVGSRRSAAPARGGLGPSMAAGAEVAGRLRDSVLAWSDPAARHRRRTARAQASARATTVLAAVSTGAGAVLVPWHGVGAPDSIWVALSAGTLTAAAFGWQRVRRLARTAPPPAPPRAGSAARPAMDRLGVARRSLGPVLSTLGPFAAETAADSAAAERELADLAGRIAAVEGALSCCPPTAAAGLLEARAVLVASLEQGTAAFEEMVGSAATLAAAAAPTAGAATRQLQDSADRLRAITLALAELGVRPAQH